MSDDGLIEGSFVRPYRLTKGRTRSDAGDLNVEALVVATGATIEDDVVSHAEGQVLEHCEEPVAIAEVAALAGVPLGVARVLASDLAGRGHIELFENDDVDQIQIVRRLLDGIKSA